MSNNWKNPKNNTVISTGTKAGGNYIDSFEFEVEQSNGKLSKPKYTRVHSNSKD